MGVFEKKNNKKWDPIFFVHLLGLDRIIANSGVLVVRDAFP